LLLVLSCPVSILKAWIKRVPNIYAIRVCVVVKSMVFRAFIRDRIQYNLPE